MTQIVKAGNRVRNGSAPSNEAYGYVLGFEILQSYLEAKFHMFSEGLPEYKVYVAGDSMTSIHILKGNSTDVSLKAATGKVNDLVSNILQIPQTPHSIPMDTKKH